MVLSNVITIEKGHNLEIHRNCKVENIKAIVAMVQRENEVDVVFLHQLKLNAQRVCYCL